MLSGLTLRPKDTQVLHPYSYEPLERDLNASVPGRYIRLLEILPSAFKWSNHSPIECRLRHIYLQEAPEYEALSYTWGDPQPACSVICNGKSLTVRQNLFNALRRLRRWSESRLIWIDAICINQEDLDEKSNQISLMKDIYAGAQQVIVWLGEESDDSALGLSLVPKLRGMDAINLSLCKDELTRPRIFLDALPIFVQNGVRTTANMVLDGGSDDDSISHRSGSETNFEQTVGKAVGKAFNKVARVGVKLGLLDEDDVSDDDSGSGSDSRMIAAIRALPRCDEPAWRALRTVMDRPWFSRIWVVQEIAFAKKAMVMCGPETVPWDELVVAGYAIAADIFQENFDVRDRPRVIDLHKCSQSITHNTSSDPNAFTLTCKSSLQDLFQFTLHTDATDPRDKIFALLGLVDQDTAKERCLQTNYRADIIELYRDVTGYLIRRYRHLDVLSWVGLRRELHGLPSWVPDWSVPQQVVALGRFPEAFTTCLSYSVKLGQCDDTNLLLLTGKRFDKISRVGSILDLSKSNQRVEASLRATILDWETLANFYVPSRDGDSPTTSFWRTIIANVDDEGDVVSDSFVAHFVAWYQRYVSGSLDVHHFRIPSTDDSVAPDAESFGRRVVEACRGRRFCITAKGTMCVASALTEVGDIVAVFEGGKYPFVLGPNEQGTFALKGPCYLGGINLTNVMKDANIETEMFVLE